MERIFLQRVAVRHHADPPAAAPTDGTRGSADAVQRVTRDLPNF
jgi:hypothetical protein